MGAVVEITFFALVRLNVSQTDLSTQKTFTKSQIKIQIKANRKLQNFNNIFYGCHEPKMSISDFNISYHSKMYDKVYLHKLFTMKHIK